MIKDYDTLKDIFVKRGHDFAGRPFEEMYDRFRIMNPEKDYGEMFSGRIFESFLGSFTRIFIKLISSRFS